MFWKKKQAKMKDPAREQEPQKYPWLAARDRTEYLNLYLAQKPNANDNEQQILQALAKQDTEDKISNPTELVVKLKETEASLWATQLKYLDGPDFISVLTPTMQKVYWLGYRNGYFAVEEKRINNSDAEKAPDGFCGKSLDVYHKGFKDGKHFWYFMWTGM